MRDSLRSISLVAACLAWPLLLGVAGAQVQPCEPCLDLAPRGATDGRVTVGDAILLQRMVVGIDVPSQEERRRGDVAPAVPDGTAAALGESPTPVFAVGDDALTVGDVVLALRVVTGATSLRLLPDLELSFATPPRSCLRSSLTLYGHGLIVGDDRPTVFVDGQPAIVGDLRRGWEHGEPFDRITVQDQSEQDSAEWTERSVDVLVRTGRGDSLLESAIPLTSACERAPNILRVEPLIARRGETVRIAGTDLACVTEVDFVGRQTPGLVLRRPILAVHSDNALDVRAPDAPQTRETFDVWVRNDCGQGRSPGFFEFPEMDDPKPDATWLLPTAGPARGGFSLRLGGVDLQALDFIRFGSTVLGPEAFMVLANGEVLIPAVPPSPLPPAVTVPVSVVVSGYGLEDETPLVLTYIGEGVPECGAVAPSTGGLGGGTSVIITAALGSSFDAVDRVLFGSLPATGLVHPNSAQVLVLTPAVPTAIEVEISLEVDGAPVATCAQTFTYE